MVGRIGLGLTIAGVEAAVRNFQNLREGYGSDARWIVGVGAEYGAFLEFGTSKMRAYPFFFPAARHVMATQFAELERKAHSQPNPTEWLVQELALAIEAQAKANASAGPQQALGRSPGTHPEHPKRVTGNLVSSIEAAPANAFGSGGRFPSP